MKKESVSCIKEVVGWVGAVQERDFQIDAVYVGKTSFELVGVMNVQRSDPTHDLLAPDS